MKNKQMIIYSAVVGGFFAIFFWFTTIDKPAYDSLDEFAQCLSDKGAVMYGADWCSHCKNEKNAFGDSFRLINYVECPDEPGLCLEKGINGYPTWIFSDSSSDSGQAGKKLEGEQGLERLSRESGCGLPE